MRQNAAALLSAALLLICFQNCSSNKVGFSPENATAASTAPPNAEAEGAVPNPTPAPTPAAPGGDVLNGFNFTDISKISFVGILNLRVAGTYTVTSDMVLDHVQHSFDAKFGASGSYIRSLVCQSRGAVSDYNALESALQKMSFSITHMSIPFDFVSAALRIDLRDGTVKGYTLDTGLARLSVDNFTHVDAAAFKSLMKDLLLHAGCSY